MVRRGQGRGSPSARPPTILQLGPPGLRFRLDGGHPHEHLVTSVTRPGRCPRPSQRTYPRTQCEPLHPLHKSVAFTVIRSLGIGADSASIPYLAAWAESADLSVIEKTAGLIDRLAKRLEDALQSVEAEASADAQAEDQDDVDERSSELLTAVAA